jgi:hypothetical protein
MKHFSGGLFLIAIFFVATAIAQNSATTVSVDVSANRHPINPNVYGINWGEAPDAALNVTISRHGGNANSRYNWQLDAHSSGSDWYFETYSDGNTTPGASVDDSIRTSRAALTGAELMITIPMIDYLANLGPGRSTLPGFPVKKYGAQQKADPYNTDAGNGVSLATGKNITNDPSDNGVANSADLQKAWVQHLVNTFGLSSTATGIKYYILDNEPSIWNFTHRDAHPNPLTYQEMYDKVIAYATAVRSVDPAAKIVFGEEWSWSPMFISGFDQAHGLSAANSDYNTHNKTYYYAWMLQQLYAYKQKTGVQLIDMLTVHMYPPIGTTDAPSEQTLRNRETRILWDLNYSDPAWFGDVGINSRIIGWIPTMKSIVAKNYPGLQIGCTEYTWGDDDQLNGATTQADVLGIYGREGLDLATRWGSGRTWGATNPTYYVTYLAHQIYRNYDDANSTFGDTTVSATVANPDNLSAFAAIRSSDGALTVMVINKQQGSTPVTVNLANFSSTGSAQAWQINSVSQQTITHLSDVAIANNALTNTVPSQSVTLFVIPASTVLAAPTAPAGLAGSVGSGTVALTWNALGDATSYTVKRAGTAGGPYATVGTVNSSAPSAYNDSGLTDGATYYYVVSATNSAGKSPDSAELAILVQPSDAHLINISTRSFVGTDSNILIAGFVLTGTHSKTILIRASGPALTSLGVGGALAEPTVKLLDHTGTQIQQNTGWGTATNAATIKTTAANVGAFAWADGSKDSAILVDLPPGLYTAQVSSASGGTGVGMIELYDTAATVTGAQLINISSRSVVLTDANIQIAGFVINGTQPKKVLIRASGPALAGLGVSGTLANPALRLFDQTGTLISANTAWGNASNTADIKAAAARVGAFDWVDGSKDSALLVSLSPGIYSAQVSGVSGGTGGALIEVYDAN